MYIHTHIHAHVHTCTHTYKFIWLYFLMRICCSDVSVVCTVSIKTYRDICVLRNITKCTVHWAWKLPYLWFGTFCEFFFIMQKPMKSCASSSRRRDGRLVLCGGELSLFLGPKCLSPVCVSERRMQVWSWKPASGWGSSQTSPPEKHPED